MENFRKLCENIMSWIPRTFFTVPGMAWDAMLKMTGIKLELLEDVDMLLMIEKGIRGGISNAFKRYAKANNKFMKDFDSCREKVHSSFIWTQTICMVGQCRSLFQLGDLSGWLKPIWKNWERFVDEKRNWFAFWKLIWNILWNCMIFHNDFSLAPEKMIFGKKTKLKS